jgi:hypothetical protein
MDSAIGITTKMRKAVLGRFSDRSESPTEN